MSVRVNFKNKKAQKEFETEWIARTHASPIDEIVNGIEYSGANAERAVDISNQISGVTITYVYP